MKKSKSSKFLSGALIGSALGVAVGIFASSKKGKEVTKDVSQRMVGFYKTISPKLKKMKALGEKEYKNFIDKALTDYDPNGELNEADLKKIANHAKASWKHLKKHL